MNHSYFSATSGSTRAARKAGTSAAVTADAFEVVERRDIDIVIELIDVLRFTDTWDAVELLGEADAGDADAEALRELREEAKRPAFGPEVLNAERLGLGPSGHRSYYVFSGTSEDLAHRATVALTPDFSGDPDTAVDRFIEHAVCG